MKKMILKPIITVDMKKVYNFFDSNKDTYKLIPISADKLCKLLGYSKKDVINIIKSINKEPKFKKIILGSTEGFYFIDKSNTAVAIRILLEKTNRCCRELENIQHLKNKLNTLC